MTYIPLKYPPGVSKTDSPYTNYMDGGRITDMNGMRFVAGYPEAIRGAVTMSTSIEYSNIFSITNMKDLRDFSDNKYLIVSGPLGLAQVVSTSTGSASNITPLRATTTGNLVNPFSTVNGTSLVTVTHTAHRQQTGDYVTLGTTTAGGIVIGGLYTNIQVLNTNSYTLAALTNANANTTNVGGTAPYSYYRTTLTNPFAVTTGVSTATVTHTAHGASLHDLVAINGASAVGGITPSGIYQVSSIPSADTYTIVHGTSATSSATGGGSPNFQYSIAAGTAALTSRVWTLAPYGQLMLASPTNGTIYVYNPSIGGKMYYLPNAPTGIKAIFVTPERFPFALGNSSNPLQVQWPDQNDFTDWTPTDSNTANIRTLQEGSTLVGGIAVRDGVSIVLTDTACYAFNYSGDNFVYQSFLAGRGCGLVGALAINEAHGVGYWISKEDFWAWDGSLRKLPSEDIHDYVFNDLNTSLLNQCICATIAARNEVWFIYPSLEDGDSAPTRYVIYHTDQNRWSIGRFSTQLTAMLDRNLFFTPAVTKPYPIISAASGNILALDVVGADSDNTGFGFSTDELDGSYVQYSPMEIARGDAASDIFRFIPDIKDFSEPGTFARTLSLDLFLQDKPASGTGTQSYTIGTAISTSTFLAESIDMRENARLVGHRIRYDGAGFYRIGVSRLNIQPAGRRT